MPFILETERLKLRKFSFDDIDFVIETLNTAGYLRFIGNKNVKTAEDAKKYIENTPLKSYQEHGFGLWVVIRKEDEQKVGMSGLFKREYLEYPDIGYAFLPRFEGKGYASEIGKAIIDYAQNELKIPKILATVLPENQKSIRLLEKIGFIFTQNLLQNEEELLLYAYK